MAARWRLKCIECNKEETFLDTKDVSQQKWTMLAWAVKENEPIVVCPKCDYNPSVIKNKK